MTQMASPLKTGRRNPILTPVLKCKLNLFLIKATEYWFGALIIQLIIILNTGRQSMHFLSLSWENLREQKCRIRGFESQGGLINPAIFKLLKVQGLQTKLLFLPTELPYSTVLMDSWIWTSQGLTALCYPTCLHDILPWMTHFIELYED